MYIVVCREALLAGAVAHAQTATAAAAINKARAIMITPRVLPVPPPHPHHLSCSGAASSYLGHCELWLAQSQSVNRTAKLRAASESPNSCNHFRGADADRRLPRSHPRRTSAVRRPEQGAPRR